MVYVRILTIDDLEFDNKTVFLRVDMNCPIDSQTLEISGTKRIEEIIDTLNSLKNAKIVIASHQGRVGNKDYTSMAKHAKILEKLLNRKIKYTDDIIGTTAQNEIKNLETSAGVKGLTEFVKAQGKTVKEIQKQQTRMQPNRGLQFEGDLNDSSEFRKLENRIKATQGKKRKKSGRKSRDKKGKSRGKKKQSRNKKKKSRNKKKQRNA